MPGVVNYYNTNGYSLLRCITVRYDARYGMFQTLSTANSLKVACNTLKLWTKSYSCFAAHFTFRRFIYPEQLTVKMSKIWHYGAWLLKIKILLTNHIFRATSSGRTNARMTHSRVVSRVNSTTRSGSKDLIGCLYVPWFAGNFFHIILWKEIQLLTKILVFLCHMPGGLKKTEKS